MVALSYREYCPPDDLAGWIACFWEIKGRVAQGSAFAHRVLPDGCADLLFDLQDCAGSAATHAEVVGPMSTSTVVTLRAAVELLGVRLRPGAVGAFLGIAADRLLDSMAPLREAPAALRIDPAELASLPDSAARIRRLTMACRARLGAMESCVRGPPLRIHSWLPTSRALRWRPASGAREGGFDPIVDKALASWTRRRPEVGFPTVSVLVRDIGLSERAFERRFVANVGLTPVRFRRLARLRAVLRSHSEGARDWADLATVAGFSDQSHLVRDFQAFVGLSPTKWAATQAPDAGFLQDGQLTAL